MVLLYDEHLGDTIITGNIDLIGNIILESRDLVLSHLHIGIHTRYAKYRIYPSKTETVINTTLHKSTERIESCKCFEDTDD